MATRKWGPEKLVNGGLVGHQIDSSVTALAGGGFVVVWQDDSGLASVIRGQRYDAEGNKVGAEMNLSGSVSTTGQQTAPSVTGLADGGFYVSWTDEGGFGTGLDIVGGVFDAGGGLVRSQHALVDFFDADTSVVARLGTGAVAVWENDNNSGDIAFRIFDAAGNAGAVQQANATTIGPQTEAAVAATPGGARFAIVWRDEIAFAVKGRLIDATGGEVASEFTVGNGGLGARDPAVAWLNDGDFAVAWTEGNTFDFGGEQIKVKIFNGLGSLVIELSDEILVNATSFGSQLAPAITALPGGGFVVSWEDNSGVGGDAGQAVRLQAFDGLGNRIGGEMLVNTTTTGAQVAPSVAALADGRVAVSWTDLSSGDADIRMQIVDPRDGIVTGSVLADTLYGHDLVGDEISGYTGTDLLIGLRGSDGLYGGEGKDTLQGGADGDLLYGGTGGDTASYAGATAAVVVALDGSLAAEGEAVGDSFASVENLTGSKLGDRLRGNAGGNLLFGADGNDSLGGLAGNDRLRGGAGADSLTGGLGNDRFLYIALGEAGDTVSDFASTAGNSDLFQFKGNAFAGLPPGALAAANFVARADNAAQDGNDFFVFRTTDDTLWFDANGNGAGGPTLIADLSTDFNLTAAHILIV